MTYPTAERTAADSSNPTGIPDDPIHETNKSTHVHFASDSTQRADGGSKKLKRKDAVKFVENEIDSVLGERGLVALSWSDGQQFVPRGPRR